MLLEMHAAELRLKRSQVSVPAFSAPATARISSTAAALSSDASKNRTKTLLDVGQHDNETAGVICRRPHTSQTIGIPNLPTPLAFPFARFPASK